MFMIFPSERGVLHHNINLLPQFLLKRSLFVGKVFLHRRLDESEEYVCIPAIITEILLSSGVTVPKARGTIFHYFFKVFVKRDTFMPTATNSRALPLLILSAII